MNTDVASQIKQAVLENKLPIFLGGIGFVLIVVSLLAMIFAPKDTAEITFTNDAKLTNASGSATLIVDIEGAVEKPGVYTLPFGSRFQDGLIAAGGLSALADREKIAKGMNLAMKLTDGAKVYFPGLGEVNSVSVGVMGNMGEVGGVSTININEANEAQLDTLSGVGPVTAQKIISARPYMSIEELVSRKIVGQSVFEKIKDRISVY